MILSGERMPGMEDGPDPDFTVAVIDAALRRVPQTCRSEPADLAAAHSSGLPPNKARHGRRPESDSGPRFPPPGAAGGARLIHVFPSMTSRLLPCVRGPGSALGALEVIESCNNLA